MRAATVFLALCLIGASYTKPHNGKREANPGLDWNFKWKNFPLPGEQGGLSGNLNGDFEYGNVFDSAKGWDFLKGRYNNFKDGLKELVGLHKRKRSADPAGVKNTWEGVKKDVKATRDAIKEQWEKLKDLIGLGGSEPAEEPKGTEMKKRSADPHGFGEKFAHTWEGIKKDYHAKKARKEAKKAEKWGKLIDKIGDKFMKLEDKKEKLFSKIEDKKADLFMKLEDKKAKKWSKLANKFDKGGSSHKGSYKSAWKSEYKKKKNEKLYNIGHALGYKAGYYLGLKSGGGKGGHHKRSANPAGVKNTWNGIKADVKATREAIKKQWENLKDLIGLGGESDDTSVRRKREADPEGFKQMMEKVRKCLADPVCEEWMNSSAKKTKRSPEPNGLKNTWESIKKFFTDLLGGESDDTSAKTKRSADPNGLKATWESIKKFFNDLIGGGSDDTSAKTKRSADPNGLKNTWESIKKFVTDLLGGSSDDTSTSKSKRSAEPDWSWEKIKENYKKVQNFWKLINTFLRRKRSLDDSEVEGIVAQLESKFDSNEMLSRHQRSPAGIDWMKLLGLENLPDLREAIKFKVKQGGREKTLNWDDLKKTVKKFIKKRKLKIELQK